jgi:hypothetical protein
MTSACVWKGGEQSRAEQGRDRSDRCTVNRVF